MAVHPPDKMASVRIVKKFLYRGVQRNFSNRYHIGVNFPQSDGAWAQLIANVAGAEQSIYPQFALGGATIIEGIGYAPNSNIPVHTSAFNSDGTLAIAGWAPAPGDVAALVKYTTPDKSVRNHPIYLFSYHHAVANQGAADGDLLQNAQHTAMQAFHDKWLVGFSDGSTTYRRSRPNNGTIATSVTVETFLSHRDLPRA